LRNDEYTIIEDDTYHIHLHGNLTYKALKKGGSHRLIWDIGTPKERMLDMDINPDECPFCKFKFDK